MTRTSLPHLLFFVFLSPLFLNAPGKELAPGSSHTFLFPDLPISLWSERLKIEKQTACTVQLPEDYTPEKKYPLVLMMGGSHGDHGYSAKGVRKIVGDTGVICLSLPLFKKDLAPLKENESNKWNRLYIGPDEAENLWSSYEKMLEKVFAEIPNIDRDLCFMGGFSNGANSTAVQLIHPDVGGKLREYFDHFIFIEGGHVIRPGPHTKDAVFLLAQGGTRRDWLRAVADRLGAADEVEVTLFTMPETGHEFPGPEKHRVGNWIREKCGLPPLPPEK
jgi:predicted esterase